MSHGRWGGRVIGPCTSVKTHMLSILGSMCVGGSTALNMYCTRSGPQTHLVNVRNSRACGLLLPLGRGTGTRMWTKGPKKQTLSRGFLVYFFVFFFVPLWENQGREEECKAVPSFSEMRKGWGRQPGPCPLIVVRFTKKVSSQENGTCQASIYMKLLSLNIF